MQSFSAIENKIESNLFWLHSESASIGQQMLSKLITGDFILHEQLWRNEEYVLGLMLFIF